MIYLEIIINNKKINYEIEGEGKPIILLHGWLASLETMRVLQNHLSKHFKVYNVDIIGFGKSDLPDRPLNTDDFGDFLNYFINTLKIDKPILIGHSHGGRTIINYAGRNLGKINKIVLIDSAGVKPKRKISYYFKVYSFKIVKSLVKILPKKCVNLREKALSKFGSDDYKNSPEILRKTMNIILNEDQQKLMSNINVPTLLIWGDKDTATPIRDAKIMEKLIQNSGIAVLEGAGHFSYLDNLRQCLIILDEFLKNDID